MSAISYPLYITGLDPASGQMMLGGMFRMHDEIGFPIDCCIDEAKERGFLIDWLECLCDCWLNSCLKYDSLIRQIKHQLDADLDGMFKNAGCIILNRFPKMKKTENPVDTFCRYILSKKKLRLGIIVNE